MLLRVVPFLIPGLECVEHEPWRLVTSEGESSLLQVVDPWDYQSTIQLRASVKILASRILEQTHLAQSSRLTVFVKSHSSQTRIESLVCSEPVPIRDLVEVQLYGSLPGAELGGRLTLRTYLVTTAPSPLDPLAPQDPGSILWSSTQITDLEGEGGQFPMDSMSFAEVFPPSSNRSGWMLSMQLDDLEAAFVSAVRLNMNSDSPKILKVLQGDTDPESRQLLKVINFDVTRQLLYAALNSNDVLQLEVDGEASTLGGVLRNIVAFVFPTDSVATVRNWVDIDPGRIERRLQQFAGVV